VTRAEPPENPRERGREALERQAQALDRAWEAFEEGDLDSAHATVDRLMRETRRHPEVRFLRAVLLLDDGDPAEALAELTALRGKVEDEPLLRYYRALACFDLARFEEAEAELASLCESDLDPATLHSTLAQVREHLGRFAEAEADDRAAHAADPELFPLPLRLSRTEFESVVDAARARLPENLSARLEEIAIVVEDLPPRAILVHPEGEGLAPDLLGLFVGRNLREESVFEVPGLPAAIYIYQRNLERACRSREELIAEIETTLYHELGHYLGLEEEQLRDRGMD
jgi:predicted Zn-dependent protease with MMP-like domain